MFQMRALNLNNSIYCSLALWKHSQNTITKSFDNATAMRFAALGDPLGDLRDQRCGFGISQCLKDGSAAVQIRENNRCVNTHSR